MIQLQELSSWFKHPDNFRHGAGGVWYGTEDQGFHDRIKMMVRERKGGVRCFYEIGVTRRTLPGYGAELNIQAGQAFYLAQVIIGKIHACPRPDLQDLPVGMGNQVFTDLSEQEVFQRVHEQIIGIIQQYLTPQVVPIIIICCFGAIDIQQLGTRSII